MINGYFTLGLLKKQVQKSTNEMYIQHKLNAVCFQFSTFKGF